MTRTILSATPILRPAALLAGLLLTFSTLASAQYQEGAPRPPGSDRLEGMEWVDFEVLSVDPQEWIVTAREVEGGGRFQFRMPPQVFHGQQFTADLSGARPGQPVDVQGKPDAKFDQLTVEMPLEAGRPAGGTGDNPLLRSSPRPGGPPGSKPERRRLGAPGNGRPGIGGGPSDYRVESFDPRTRIATVRGSDGSTAQLEIDPQAFVGYRFRAPVRDLRRGMGFAMLALNQLPIENCCKLVDGGR